MESSKAKTHRLRSECGKICAARFTCEVLSNMKRLLFRLHGAKNKEQVFAYLKTKGGIEGKLWYYHTFADALRRRKEYPELAYELEIAVRDWKI